MITATRRLPRHLVRLLVLLTTIAAATAGLLTISTQTASAASYIAGPASFSCGNRTIAVSPPRVWASYRTEQVVWQTQIERWDPVQRRWYSYGARFDTWSSFNVYGQQVVAWSGGRFVNSRLHLYVSHPGHYRLASAVAGTQGGQQWVAYVANGAYCTMP